jgi:glycopeptide antibiotics resistance protein
MWLGSTAQLAPLAVLALLVAFPVSLAWHARRGRMLWATRLATADALLVGSVLVILRATLPSTDPGTGLDSWTWMPFEDLIRAWPLSWARGVILDQMGANVLLFVPFGLALTLRGRRVPAWRVALASLAFSVGIELTQGLAGNGRSADITDVLMNTLGGVCGWVLGRLVLRVIHEVAGWWRRRTGPGSAGV